MPSPVSEFLLASPWPPARSEIARHVAGVQLPALQSIAQAHLLGDMPAGTSIPAVRGLPVADVDAGLLAHPDIALLAHVGNEASQNQAALRALAQRPGFVVLHDLVLHHAWRNACHRDGRPGDYLDSVARHGGPAAAEAAAAHWGGPLPPALGLQTPLFEPCLDNALGVIVHSQMAFDGVAARGRWPVCRLNLPHPAPADSSRLLARRQAQAAELVAGAPLRLLVFGHLGRNRCLPQIIDSLECLLAQGHERFRLDILGETQGTDDLLAMLRQKGLADRVTLHGFVTDTVLDAALQDAHLALNLRAPTMGEASASQLRLYAAGLPSIVVRAGWYGEQPRDAAHHMSDRLDPAELAGAILKLWQQPRRLSELAAGGLAQLARCHGSDLYARQLLAFMAEAAPEGQRWRLARNHLYRASLPGVHRPGVSFAELAGAIAGLSGPAPTAGVAWPADVPLPCRQLPVLSSGTLALLLTQDATLGGVANGDPLSLSDPLPAAPIRDADLATLALRARGRTELPPRLRRGPLAWPRVSAFLLRAWSFISRDWREPLGLVHGMLGRQATRIANLERSNQRMLRQLAGMQQTLEALRPPLAPDAVGQRQRQAETRAMQDAFMEKLGAHFRGDSVELQNRLRVHLPVVAQAFVQTGLTVAGGGSALGALDIGCGRGEWLALLRDAGHLVHGVDLLGECVAACAEQGLSAECGDAFEVLRATPSGSLALVTAFHVVEHLPLEEQINLVSEAFRALAPGGLLLLETPNAENLGVISRNFWYDPTHQRPVPAELLRVMALAAGFDAQRTTTCFLQAPDVSEAERLTYPERLQHLLFCGQDLALYAWKP